MQSGTASYILNPFSFLSISTIADFIVAETFWGRHSSRFVNANACRAGWVNASPVLCFLFRQENLRPAGRALCNLRRGKLCLCSISLDNRFRKADARLGKVTWFNSDKQGAVCVFSISCKTAHSVYDNALFSLAAATAVPPGHIQNVYAPLSCSPWQESS